MVMLYARDSHYCLCFSGFLPVNAHAMINILRLIHINYTMLQFSDYQMIVLYLHYN